MICGQQVAVYLGKHQASGKEDWVYGTVVAWLWAPSGAVAVIVTDNGHFLQAALEKIHVQGERQ